MDVRVAALLSAQGGAAGWPQLARMGVSPSEVQRWVRAGRLVRVRRGAYACPSVWGRLAPGLRACSRVRQVLAGVDPLCESPGETRTRLLLSGFGLPVQSQVEIRDAVGAFVARVDFLVAGKVIVEFDGAVKYAGADGRDALVAEKRREDRLRALGYVVVRVTWGELDRPAAVLHRIHGALASSPR